MQSINFKGTPYSRTYFDYLYHYKYLAIIFNSVTNILQAISEHNCYVFSTPQRSIAHFNDVHILRFYSLLSNCPPEILNFPPGWMKISFTHQNLFFSITWNELLQFKSININYFKLHNRGRPSNNMSCLEN